MLPRQLVVNATSRMLTIPHVRWHSSTRSATAISAGPEEEKSLRVAHILLSADDINTASNIESSLEGGSSFEDLAKEYSKCTASSSRGGELGWLSRGSYFPSFEEAAFSTPVGKVSRATTGRGLHLIKVLEERFQAVVQQVHVTELSEVLANPILLEEEGVQLVDVREPWEYETSRLPGFRLLPLSQVGEWAPCVQEELDPEREVVVLCHHGVRSMQVAQLMVSKGFKKVKNVTGGIHAYSQVVDSSVPMY